jgi:anti-sigma factor ChrR (cupin superfamily)
VRFCERLGNDDRERAELYALGALDEAQAATLEDHLRDCPVCRREVDELRAAADELDFAPPPVEPSPELRRRLLGNLVPRGATLLRRAEGEWAPTGVDGVDLRVLFADAAQDRQTILLRMAPGATFPVHLHHGAEECLVLEGDVRDGDLEMTAGDFVRFEEGTQHGPLQTREGNLLLIVSSLHDEIVG